MQTLEKEKTAAKTPAADNRPRRERPDNKMTFKERREFETLGGEIEALSEEKTALEDFFSAAVSPDPQEFADKSRRYEEVKNLLDEKELRWLELSEKS